MRCEKSENKEVDDKKQEMKDHLMVLKSNHARPSM
jgi:hypothetical protein